MLTRNLRMQKTKQRQQSCKAREIKLNLFPEVKQLTESVVQFLSRQTALYLFTCK